MEKCFFRWKGKCIAIGMPVKLLLKYSKTSLTLTLRLSSRRGQNWFIFLASWKPIFYLFTFPLTIMFQITIHKWNNFSKLLSSFYKTFQCKTTSVQYVAGVTVVDNNWSSLPGDAEEHWNLVLQEWKLNILSPKQEIDKCKGNRMSKHRIMKDIF